jgi:hypothetical protein
MPAALNCWLFPGVVQLPATANPRACSACANGNPNHPKPMILILFIATTQKKTAIYDGR